MFGAATRGTLHGPTEFTETVGLFASFFVWTVFGALFVGPVLTTRIDATAIAYAVLSLTVVRMVPVAISLIGSRPSTRHRRVHGVVRPPRAGLGRVHARRGRGASTSGAAFDAIVEVATWTILLSVMAHGLTAGPFARAYGRRMREAGDVPELSDVPEPRVAVDSSAPPDPAISLCGLRGDPCGDGAGGSHRIRTRPTLPGRRKRSSRSHSGHVKCHTRKSSCTSSLFRMMLMTRSPTPMSDVVAPPPSRRTSSYNSLLFCLLDAIGSPCLVRSRSASRVRSYIGDDRSAGRAMSSPMSTRI